jgi:nucleotide-binding universal stress UspA family protein
MLSRILVPLDGSPAMLAALPQVRQLVSGTGANVRLLLVRPVPKAPERRGDGWAYLDELVCEEYATWQAYLRHHGSALAYDGIVVEREVRFGELLPEVLATASRCAPHVIVLATPARSLPRWRRQPPLAQQLMERAAVPVLLVRPTCPAAGAVVVSYRSAPI